MLPVSQVQKVCPQPGREHDEQAVQDAQSGEQEEQEEPEPKGKR